ncbi:alpha/beta fold hydrolase [Pseudonocardia humida]|uniref:Alpha/beta hydrolase n=1 Tax=Pseudonocardia humida TaxID=2800819 RepID=A0ABT0ZYI9_9PSEU|nr:alpha/beta hydrolase [Pseudonocardia humida]MCO1655758.1 alpha/beta hydrolase [Pseudonocardia humida]
MTPPPSPSAPPAAATDAPRWFRTALAVAPRHLDTTVEGCRVHLRCWGSAELPGLVLVHGGAAHSGWWDHIAPFFAETHRVVALDLSGHGDSGRRPDYDMRIWADEVLAAAAAGGITGAPLVVGHSMGGWVAAQVGVEHGDRVDGIAIIDSPLNDQPPEEDGLRRRRRQTRVYPSREEMVERFRTMPEQDVLLPYVRRHIAEQSVQTADGGWTWKFDPTMFGRRRLLREMLPQLRCRAAFIRTEFGLVPPSMAAEIDALLGHRVPIVELPDAGHHPMLDQPLPLVTALRMLLMQWARP